MIPPEEAENILAGVDVVESESSVDDDGTVVALAHGAGGGVRENFGVFLDATRQRRYRFIGPYYPGAGTTPTPDGALELELLADQVVASGIRLGANRFPVIGLSLGAAVAATAAARHPEHVSALVLTVGLAHQDAQIGAFARIWSALAAHAEWDALAELMIHATGTTRTLTDMDTDTFAETVAAVRASYPEGGARHAELAARTDVTALFDEISVPTLVIVGGQDRIILPDTARAFSRIHGAEVVEYREAGHIFTPDQQSCWAGDVFAFLDRM